MQELSGVPCLTQTSLVAAESIGRLKKDLDATKESQRYVESQEEAGPRVLARSHEERNKLEAEKQQQAEEIESLKTQLAQAFEENQRLKGGMFGLLTGCPEEEMNSFEGNLLKELSIMPERARKTMKSMVKGVMAD